MRTKTVARMQCNGIRETRGADSPHSAALHAGYGLFCEILDNTKLRDRRMVLYRRNRVAGGTYFFTVTLRDRSSDVLVRHVAALRHAFRATRAERPFTIDAIVILPDHLHAIWTLPEGDADYSGRWRAIKSSFTHALSMSGMELAGDSRGGYRLWQRRFWEHTIRDDLDFERHVNYVHWNPMKHGVVSRIADWPYSSFHRYFRLGLLPEDWAGGVEETAGTWMAAGHDD